jgi:hypothetical protein
MRTISRVLVVGLLLPQAALAWEWRVGGGTTASGLLDEPNGVHFALGVQNRIRNSAMYFRGDFAVSQQRSSRFRTDAPFGASPDGLWQWESDSSPRVMVGPAIIFQGRPDASWSPYVIGGFDYHFVHLRHDLLQDGQPVSSHSWSSSGFNTNYGVGLQAGIGRATGFLEFRKHGSHAYRLTLGLGL